ncbi:DUF4232 domain-containing protein [Streptomyces huiliensis]|uniref:DUF4232 domain-containing protein n=1 Tax=Streptomyces huiliensis TaxID=2876027 RepID=UPI001CBE4BC1|nr:DUF4232 domain-containing protein [Streptomyces huiliensis]MBZ4318405.1 DUF4232 domain-containing protein [Streptomyces huiliensis]
MHRMPRTPTLAALLIVGTVAPAACARPAPAPAVREEPGGRPGTAAGPRPTAPAPLEVPHGGATPSATAAPCPREGLRVTVGPVDGAMGLRSMAVRLDNCGTAPRTVEGHPGLRVLGEKGEALDVAVHDDATAVARSGVPNTPARPVTLRPGAAAVAVVLWRNTYDDTRRPPLLGRRLEVTPAPGVRAQTVEPEGGVDLGSTGKLAVGAWKPAG